MNLKKIVEIENAYMRMKEFESYMEKYSQTLTVKAIVSDIEMIHIKDKESHSYRIKEKLRLQIADAIINNVEIERDTISEFLHDVYRIDICVIGKFKDKTTNKEVKG